MPKRFHAEAFGSLDPIIHSFILLLIVHFNLVPKAACRRVAVTPPPPASRRSGGGGATAYMPGKLVGESEEERQRGKTESAEQSERGKRARGLFALV